MSTIRLTEFKARRDTIDTLKKFLTELIPHMKQLEGFEGGMLIEKSEDPVKFIMVEYWTSVEAHKASAKTIPPELIAQVLPMLGGIPSGSYYDIVQKAEL